MTPTEKSQWWGLNDEPIRKMGIRGGWKMITAQRSWQDLASELELDLTVPVLTRCSHCVRGKERENVSFDPQRTDSLYSSS